MITIPITYKDYNGVERKEDFLFNLSQAECAEAELSRDGGISAMIKKIVDSKDQKRIIEVFKDFLIKSYGVKSDDGRQFIKNQQVTDAFVQTEAYSQLFMRLASDEKFAAEFVNGIIPNVSAPATTPATQPSNVTPLN